MVPVLDLGLLEEICAQRSRVLFVRKQPGQDAGCTSKMPCMALQKVIDAKGTTHRLVRQIARAHKSRLDSLAGFSEGNSDYLSD